MKNLSSYSDSAFRFHKDTIASKYITITDPGFKARVSSLNVTIEKAFDEYDKKFATNSLHELCSLGYKGQDKLDLQSLYRYDSERMQQLKNMLTTLEKKRILNTCQNCTINEIDSFDHIVPQGEFAEFVVNPKNLFPSCTKCNRQKNSIWRSGGKMAFLNLYLDTLPTERYLFAEVTDDGEVITVNFKIENPHNIDKSLFDLIAQHYEKLELLGRFSVNIDSVVTPLTHAIESNIEVLTIEEAKVTSINASKRNMLAFGHNYWKSVLEIALLENKDFLRRFI